MEKTLTDTEVSVLADGSRHVADWVRMRALAWAADGRGGPPVCGVDALGSLTVDPPGARCTDLVATSGQEVTGWVRVVLPDEAQAPAVVESLVVHPRWRSGGVGRRLAERARDLAADAGRRDVRIAVPEPLLPVAKAWGAEDREGSRQVFQRLDLADGPSSEPVVPKDVEVHRWNAVAPDHLAEGVARLEGHGDLDVLRALERMRRLRGRVALHTALVAPGGGPMLGYTSISLPASSPGDPEQGMTVVDPEARGHGYGELLKRLNQAALAADRPWAQRMWTANDEENHPMATLNARLGFRPWQHRRVLGWSL
ncbi:MULTISPECIES: GNAT family N-acetyltransferase [unclassified Knoellia]|uniref:GNAT family N-acetyltransferase n=1 Tax=Knoellia altitudinis TaxID=3404795 RepID=UPI003606D363